MRRQKDPLPIFAIVNPNKPWVSEEIDKLIAEWQDWSEYCQKLQGSSDYDPQTCSEAIKDGRENIHKHEILREKTLVFMRNHFSGAQFVLEKWPDHPHESVTSRLCKRAPIWVQRLEILKASMDYVQVPDGYWAGRGKEFLEALSKSTADKAVEVAASYLKNPLAK